MRIKRRNEERIAELLASRRIEGAFGTEVESIAPSSVRLKTAGGARELPNDYVFVFAGGEPPFDLLRGVGIRFGGDAAAGAARADEGRAGRS